MEDMNTCCKYFHHVACPTLAQCECSNSEYIESCNRPIDLGITVSLLEHIQRDADENHNNYTKIQNTLSALMRNLLPEINPLSGSTELFWRSEAPDSQGRRPIRCYLRHKGQKEFVDCALTAIYSRLEKYAAITQALVEQTRIIACDQQCAVAVTYQYSKSRPMPGAAQFSVERGLYAKTLRMQINSGKTIDGAQIHFGAGKLLTLPDLSFLRGIKDRPLNCGRENVTLMRCEIITHYRAGNVYHVKVSHNEQGVHPMIVTLEIPIPVLDNSALLRNRRQQVNVILDRWYISVRGHWRTKALHFPSNHVTGVEVTEIIEVTDKGPIE
ncbi:hypothetical protein NOR53_2521 [gamma proteobacterium NOR5-3]|nr:hypothetical protein NOR53_2521 [gamma proteobacterium NOR5-3]